MADRVCVMSRGRAEQIATPAELYSQPSTEFVAQFVGISSRVGVVRDRRRGGALRSRREDPRRRCRRCDGPFDALLRPEDVDVVVAPTGLGVITHKSFLGATTRLEIGIAGATVKADVISSAADDFELGHARRPRRERPRRPRYRVSASDLTSGSQSRSDPTSSPSTLPDVVPRAKRDGVLKPGCVSKRRHSSSLRVRPGRSTSPVTPRRAGRDSRAPWYRANVWR